LQTDVETGQLLLDSLVLDGVYERVHADVEVGEEQCGVVVQVRGIEWRSDAGGRGTEWRSSAGERNRVA